MAVQTPETQRADPAPATDAAMVGADSAAERDKFAPITRAMYIGMGIGAGIMLVSMAGFWLVSYQAFWIFAALAGFIIAAATWGVCFVLMLCRGGWQIFMSPPARSDRPVAEDESQSGQ